MGGRALLLALAVGAFALAAPAAAACKDDIEKRKEEAKALLDLRKRNLVQGELSAADTALKQRNEQACQRHIGNADKILRSRP